MHKVQLRALRHAFFAHMTVVLCRALDDATLKAIVKAKLEKLRTRYQATTGKQFDFDAGIVKAVFAKCSAAGA